MTGTTCIGPATSARPNRAGRGKGLVATAAVVAGLALGSCGGQNAASPTDPTSGSTPSEGTREATATDGTGATTSTTASTPVTEAGPPAGVVTETAPGTFSFAYDHADLGRVTFSVSHAPSTENGSGPGSVVATDADGATVYSYNANDLFALQPARLQVGTEPSDAFTPLDTTGNVIIDYNPGRYNGVMVLLPTPTGFTSAGTEWSDQSNARFYSATIVDRDDDGVFEIAQASNDCDPSCAAGTTTITNYRWDGSFYVAVAPPDDTRISIDAMGPLSFGMSRRDVAALGLTSPDFGCGNLRSITGGAGDLSARYDGDTIAGLSTTDPAFVTLSGIRVGATAADLQAAYGANLVAATFDGNTGPVTAFVLRSDQAVAADRFLWFTMVDGQVKWIDLLRGADDPGSMLC